MTVAHAPARPARERRARCAPAKAALWNVVLIDDDDHTYEYVASMLVAVCGQALHQGFLSAQRVDEHGRAVVYTAHLELAELKCEQIKSHGRDPLIASCGSSMHAIVVPAQHADAEDD